MRTPSLKFALAALRRYSWLITLAWGIGMLALLTIFLYRNYYLALTETEVVANLSGAVGSERVNQEQLQRALDALQARRALPPIDPKSVAPIFTPAASPVSGSSAGNANRP